MRLADRLSRWLGRVEILARGADDARRDAELALEEGRVLDARRQARALLARVPRSPLGLALWAEAAEAAWLDDEVVEALEQLVEQLPWRHDVWLRLGEAGLRAAWPGSRDALIRAAGASEAAVASAALLALARLDHEGGEAARALRWLERAAAVAGDAAPHIRLLRAAALLDLDRHEAAREALGDPADDDEPLRRRVMAQLAAHDSDLALGRSPVELALEAFVLDAPGAGAVLAELLATSHDAVEVGRVRAVIRAEGLAERPNWRAAFALAEGRDADARSALLSAAQQGDAQAVGALERLAVRKRDGDTLRALTALRGASAPPGQRQLVRALDASAAGDDGRALEALETVVGEGERGWADELADARVRAWVPLAAGAASPAADWPRVLHALRDALRRLDRLELIGDVEALDVARGRPLQLAVLGEFNAGKSTLLNALLGTDVAPTGVKPTTANLHWLSWAPDRFARIVVNGAEDRVVSFEALKPMLGELRKDRLEVERVHIYAPIERLKRMELLDTPGFNAPIAAHADVARGSFEHADAALWLLDATAPLKDSERRQLEEISSAGIPVQVLINKRDRLAPAALAEVMDYVRSALEAVGLHSMAAPLAVSARDALTGRMGDDDALAASGFAEVEQLIATELVNRSDQLREAALRRRAAAVADTLADAARETERDDNRDADRMQQVASQLATLGVTLQRADVADGLEARVASATQQLDDDLRPLASLDAEQLRDPEVVRYRVARSTERLAPAVVDAMLAAAELDEEARRDGRLLLREPVVDAVSGAAAAAAAAGVELRAAVLRAALHNAAQRVASKLLEAAETTRPASRARALRRRLELLAELLRTPPSR
jgi:GTP-binding protein EngB required for normal cell division